MRGQLMLYIDQHGGMVWARSVKELKDKVGPGRVFRIYVDKIKGSHAGQSVHCGYGIGQRWFSAFIPYEHVV